MELYILSKQDLSILSICKLADYQINLDEETNAKSTFTLMKTNGLKKGNYMTLNGLYRQFIFVIDDVQTEKGSNVVTVTALDISNIFDRKVIEKNIDTMKSKSIEEFLANTISENFVNSDDTALNVNYIEIYWHTNTQGNVATNAENGLYNFHTFLTNCRQYKNIYTDFKLENLGNPQTVEGKRINVEAKNRKIVDISLHGESTQNGTPTPDNRVEIENIEGRNIWNKSEISEKTQTVNMTVGELNVKDVPIPFTFSSYLISNALTNTNVRVSFIDSNNSNIGAVKFGNTVTSTNKRSSITINEIPEGAVKIRFGIRMQDGGHTEKTQLEEGTVATPYVPYNSLEFKDEGKNKFNVQDTNNVTEGITVDNEGWITVTGDNTDGTATKYFNYFTNNLALKTVTNYNVIAEVKNVSGTGSVNFVSVNEAAKQFQSTFNKNFSVLANNTVYNSINKTMDEFVGNTGLRTYISFAAGQSGSITFRLSVLEDTTITPENFDYEPYKSQVATFPLGEEKLMEGSYLADDGIHHRRGQYKFTGNETGWNYNSAQNAFWIRNSQITNCKNQAHAKLCNYFPYSSSSFYVAEINTLCENSNSTIPMFIFKVSTDVANSLETWKTWLQNHNLIVEYELAEEEIVPYTEEQQEAWNNIKNLTLFEGVNHISSDANMVLKYYPLESVGLKFVLRIDIENKQETTKLIDTTLPEVTDYNKVYEEDVTAKVTAYIRENNTEYNLYLKTDRTTTTNKNDPDRASGKIEVISVDTVENAPEEALNVMKGNNYKHLVEFKIAKTSKLMDVTKLHIRKTYSNQNRRRYI